MNCLKCNCGKIIKKVNCVLLSDFKNFTSRKIIFAYCPVCKNLIITLIQQRLADDKVFINENIQGANALKLLNKEILKKRVIDTIALISFKNISGWLFGKNVQIKNKKGEVTQIRQYSSYFNGNTKLTKVIDF